ncbi:hypothetical protein BTVI_134535 [Pitangus sulphuratus]|nr:hypothetical protein BTVI_134535 [Pitangus sulphuratus]
MGAALRKPERPLYKRICAIVEIQGHKYDKTSLKSLATWLHMHQTCVPEEITLEHWDKIGSTMWKAEKKGDKLAGKGLIAWRLILMLLQAKEKAAQMNSNPKAVISQSQDGGDRALLAVSPSPSHKMEGNVTSGTGRQHGCGDSIHCMHGSDLPCVGRHHLLEQPQGGGARGGDYTEGVGVDSPAYTSHHMMSSLRSTHQGITLATPPSFKHDADHALSGPLRSQPSGSDPPNIRCHGAAHAPGFEAYPSLLAPHTDQTPTPSYQSPPPPMLHRPAPMAKEQDLVPPAAFRQFSLQSLQSRYSLSTSATTSLYQPATKTYTTSHTQTSSLENITDVEDHTNITPPPLTKIIKQATKKPLTPTKRFTFKKVSVTTSTTQTSTPLTSAVNHKEHNHTSVSEASTSTEDTDDAHIFTATTPIQAQLTPGPWIDITHQIVEAHERAWKTFHNQAALAGDLEMLSAFPVHKVEGRPPEW